VRDGCVRLGPYPDVVVVDLYAAAEQGALAQVADVPEALDARQRPLIGTSASVTWNVVITSCSRVSR
jgi:hypothetical protein